MISQPPSTPVPQPESLIQLRKQHSSMTGGSPAATGLLGNPPVPQAGREGPVNVGVVPGIWSADPKNPSGPFNPNNRTSFNPPFGVGAAPRPNFPPSYNPPVPGPKEVGAGVASTYVSNPPSHGQPISSTTSPIASTANNSFIGIIKPPQIPLQPAPKASAVFIQPQIPLQVYPQIHPPPVQPQTQPHLSKTMESSKSQPIISSNLPVKKQYPPTPLKSEEGVRPVELTETPTPTGSLSTRPPEKKVTAPSDRNRDSLRKNSSRLSSISNNSNNGSESGSGMSTSSTGKGSGVSNLEKKGKSDVPPKQIENYVSPPPLSHLLFSSTPFSISSDDLVCVCVSLSQHIGESIGRGAFGQVYKGLDINTGALVAVKRVNLAGVPPNELNSLMSELHLLKRLDYKHIVKFISFAKEEDHLNFVLE